MTLSLILLVSVVLPYLGLQHAPDNVEVSVLTAEVGEVAEVELEVRGEQMIEHRRLNSEELILERRDNKYFNYFYLPSFHHLLDKLVGFFFF